MSNKNKQELNSYLSKVRGLGAARNGTATWWSQRVSALALVFLTTYFVVLVLRIIGGSNAELYAMPQSPFNTIMLTLFVSVALYHGKIGIKEIIEDYVHCEKMKVFLCIFLNFFTIFTALCGICAIIVFHFSALKLG